MRNRLGDDCRIPSTLAKEALLGPGQIPLTSRWVAPVVAFFT
jgi:hypothetical protein